MSTDAFTELHPGELRRLIREAMLTFHDETLANRTREASFTWRREAQAVLDEHFDDERLEEIRTEAEARLEELREEVAALKAKLEEEAKGVQLPPKPDLPEPEIDPDEFPEPLISSEWSFAEQSLRLKAHKAYEVREEG